VYRDRKGRFAPAPTLRDCKYRSFLKMARRVNLSLSGGDTPEILIAWYCGHPFHGIALNIGDVEKEVAEHCERCRLI